MPAPPPQVSLPIFALVAGVVFAALILGGLTMGAVNNLNGRGAALIGGVWLLFTVLATVTYAIKRDSRG